MLDLAAIEADAQRRLANAPAPRLMANAANWLTDDVKSDRREALPISRLAGLATSHEVNAQCSEALGASLRTCRACSHRLPAGTCAEPAAAGLIGAGAGWRLAWGTDAHAARCPAFAAKMPAQGRSRPYRLTKAGGDAAHARPWDDDAIDRFLDRVASFRRRGFGEQDAEDLAERAHLLDLDADDRRLCLSCRHLAGSTSTGWRCKNPRAAGLARDLPTDLVTTAQRCTGFDGVNP
jgi:hypothetical protein